MFTSIRTRLVFSYLAVIILAMGLSGLLLLSFLQRYFLDAAEDSLIAQARITAQALIPNGTIGGPVVNTQSASSNAIQQQQLGNLTLETQNSNPAAVPGSLDYARSATLQLSAEINTRIRILDAQGVVLVDSGQQRPDSARIDDSLTT
ncbi:MAG TPA: hypothetical protein VHP83_04915, partial [Aggregatilineaceae bacterium]|nr:hypothetical protein [Aggregatilineaceae bacterium]